MDRSDGPRLGLRLSSSSFIFGRCDIFVTFRIVGLIPLRRELADTI
jgi:hypothetical protein